MDSTSIQQITSGEYLQYYENRPLTELLTDSRRLLGSQGALFFALKGQALDGHDFIGQAYAKGIRQFIVDNQERVPLEKLPGANVLLVEDSLQALQQITAAHRRHYELPVVAITGSNGKTIVKEWLGQLLSQKYRVLRSPKSYNSQLGVPLSVWQLNAMHEWAVLEAGISRPGEMPRLEKIIQPQIGIFTNIGTAHEENFVSKRQKAEEKASLFAHCQKVYYCKDHALIDEVLDKKAPTEQQLFSWSFTQPADLQAEKLPNGESNLQLRCHFEQQEFHFHLPFKDEASVENALHCIALMLDQGFTADQIQHGLEHLRKLDMRLEVKQGINDCLLIDDSYNNDLAGLQIALEFMDQQQQKGEKVVILSDMLESGIAKDMLYQQIGELLQQKNVARFIGVGQQMIAYQRFFEGLNCSFFEQTDQYLENLDREDFNKQTVLVKGARVFGFEQIARQLGQKVHGTVLEIDLEALRNNLNFYRSLLSPQTKVMVMVKAFAYGSGSEEVANLLQYHRVDYLGVAYVDEAIALRESGIYLPIMVMNPSPDSFELMLEYKLEPEIYSLDILRSFIRFVEGRKTQSKIHLKIDTGMHRLGFEGHELDDLIALLKRHPELEVAAMFTHLAGADEAEHNEFSRQQVARFEQYTDKLMSELQIRPIRHVLNSAGIVRFPEYQFDMVRLGIGLYGIEVTGTAQSALIPISTLKTTISQIKHIPKGETIGYSRKGVAQGDMRIATIAIGYADGFDRRFSNGNGLVMINGQLAPTIGNVCMDMAMVDVTEVSAKEGDDVIIFGKELPLYQVTQRTGTFPYEILTGISERVKRVFYTE